MLFFFSTQIPLFFFSLLLCGSLGTATRSPLEGIFDTISPFENWADLIIAYGSSGFILEGTKNCGIETVPSDVSSSPSVSIVPFKGSENPFLPVNTSQLYTLVMVDPDAPSRTNNSLAQILHFVQTGLTITKTSDSGVLYLTAPEPPVVPYRGPEPPVHGGLHRYIFLLYSQLDAAVDLGGFSASNRKKFDVEDFARNNRLGEPLTGAYFEAQHADASDDGGNNRGVIFGVVDNTTEDDDPLDGPLLVDTCIPTPPAEYTVYPSLDFGDIVYDGTLMVSVEPSASPTEYSGYRSSYSETPVATYRSMMKVVVSTTAHSTPTSVVYSTRPTPTATKILATGEYNISSPLIQPSTTSPTLQPSTSLFQYSNAAGKLPVPSASRSSLVCLAVIITIVQVLTTGL